MGFTPPGRAPERLLIYGGEGVGKSQCWVDIIRTALKYGYKGKFYIMDTDHTWNKTAEIDEMGEAEDAGIVNVYQPLDFREGLKMAKEIASLSKSGDWHFIDMLDWGWDGAQDLYIQEVHGEEPENYFLQMRAEVKAAEAEKKGHKAQFGGQAGTDWGFINKVYRQWEYPLTIRTRAHVLSVTGEAGLDVNRGATKEDIAKYKVASKAKPKGQKGIGHRHDTIMRMTIRSTGQRQLTMVKDREREVRWFEKLDGKRTLNIDEPPSAFTRRYLRDISGWTMKRDR